MDPASNEDRPPARPSSPPGFMFGQRQPPPPAVPASEPEPAEENLGSTALEEQLKALEEKMAIQEVDYVITDSSRSEDFGHFQSMQNRLLQEKLQALTKELEEEKAQSLQKDTTLRQYQEQLAAMNSPSATHANAPALRLVEAEKRELQMIISMKLQEIEKLHSTLMSSMHCTSSGHLLTLLLSEESSASGEQLEEVRAELRSAQDQISDLETRSMHDKLSLSEKDQELFQAKKQCEWLGDELKKKLQDLHHYRQQKSREMSDTQMQLDAVIQEKSSLESRNRALQQRVDGLELSAQSFMQKVEEVRIRDTRLLRSEQSFKTEMDAQKRLALLLENNWKDAQEHLNELQKTLSEAQEDWEIEKQQMNEKLQAAEAECADWKEKFDSLYEETDRLRYQVKNGGGDPSLSNGPMSSPSVSQNSSRVTLRGMTFTSLYASFEEEKQQRVELERELEIIRDRLAEAYDRLEDMNPHLRELEQENQQLTAVKAKLYGDYSKALEERNAANARSATLESHNAQALNEINVLHQDIRDLCRQVHAFCVQLQQIRPGVQADTERYLQELIDRAGIREATEESALDAHINSTLVGAKSIEELVQQNVDLRRVARNLARQCEEAHSQLEKQREELTSAEVDKLSKKIEELEAELEKVTRQLRYVVKQRNDLKALRGGGDMAPGSPANSVSRPQTPNRQRAGASSLSEGEYESLYIQLRQDFDNYTRENGTSVKELSAQLDRLRTEKSELTIQISKYDHQLSSQQDRYQLLVSSAEMQTKEITQLRQQVANLSNIASQQDDKKQELTMRLMDERIQNEKLSNQLQHDRIAREALESGKARAMKECHDLINERNLANERGRTLQRQLEERDLSWKAEQKRINEKLEAAETELKTAQKELSAVTSKKDAQIQASSLQIQRLTVDVQRLTVENEKLKGELLLSKNKEENLSARVAELTERLTVSERRNAAYEGRADGSAAMSAEDRCRDLERELSEARKGIFARQEDLERAKAREANLRELAEANERALVEFNETYDAYKTEKEREIAELQARITELDNLRQETLEQMKISDRENIDAREKWEQERHEMEQKARAMESQIERIQATEKIALEAQAAMAGDVKRHAEFAEQAQQNYEKQVVAHSQALKTVAKMKVQHETLQKQVATSQQQAALAEASLRDGQNAWEEARAQLVRQISESQSRIDDLQRQNVLLHDQFERMQETLSERSLHQGANASQGRANDADNVSIRELRELVKHARNERDILQTKLDIAASENNRYAQELTILRNSLDELRARLAEERKKGQDSMQDNRRAMELMERVEQTNLLRESNITLRNQVEQNMTKVKELEGKLRACEAELVPLRDQLVNAQAEVEARKEENESLMKDNARWKDRVDQILRKYQRIDPVDFENLKKDVERLEAEKAALLVEKSEAVSQVAAKVAQHEDTIRRLNEMMQKQKAFYSKKIADADAAASTASQAAMEAAKAELDVLREKLAHPEKNEVVKALIDKNRKDVIQKANTNITRFREKNTELIKDVKAHEERNAALQLQLTALQTQVEQLSQAGATAAAAAESPEAAAESAALKVRVSVLELELSTARQQMEKQIADAVAEWNTKNGGELDALKLRKQLLEGQLNSEKKRVAQLTEKAGILQAALDKLNGAGATAVQTQVAPPVREPAQSAPPQVNTASPVPAPAQSVPTPARNALPAAAAVSTPTKTPDPAVQTPSQPSASVGLPPILAPLLQRNTAQRATPKPAVMQEAPQQVESSESLDDQTLTSGLPSEQAPVQDMELNAQSAQEDSAIEESGADVNAMDGVVESLPLTASDAAVAETASSEVAPSAQPAVTSETPVTDATPLHAQENSGGDSVPTSTATPIEKPQAATIPPPSVAPLAAVLPTPVPAPTPAPTPVTTSNVAHPLAIPVKVPAISVTKAEAPTTPAIVASTAAAAPTFTAPTFTAPTSTAPTSTAPAAAASPSLNAAAAPFVPTSTAPAQATPTSQEGQANVLKRKLQELQARRDAANANANAQPGSANAGSTPSSGTATTPAPGMELRKRARTDAGPPASAPSTTGPASTPVRPQAIVQPTAASVPTAATAAPPAGATSPAGAAAGTDGSAASGTPGVATPSPAPRGRGTRGMKRGAPRPRGAPAAARGRGAGGVAAPGSAGEAQAGRGRGRGAAGGRGGRPQQQQQQQPPPQ
ncbi:hypothetical protein BDZ88DRAFT_440765 [Geranomyces variabilis]|nr:hypothetical protein BDZ88DRAFT_440765 [Geranomyces variabilis]KAJ3132852.1 hypothetical protein HDU90_006571 [Geranomyces variabilis]